MGGVKLFLLFGSPIFSAIVLIYLLLPGTLVSAFNIETESNQAIEERLARLREFAKTDVCEAPSKPPTLITPQEEADAQRDFRPVPVDLDTAKVPEKVAEQVTDETPSVPSSQNPQGTSPSGKTAPSLPDWIREGTVLIFASGNNSTGLGTGFVVDDQHIITNFHVVEGATEFIATSRASGQPFSLELISTVEGDVVNGTADLALLKSNEPLNLGPLPMAPFPSIMDGVFAAGYPGFVVATDQDFQSLLAGNAGSAPSIVITQGRVSAVQNINSTSPLLVHTAEISQGNSGGPLIDECGRVVGINTFGRTDKDNAANRTVFYAQPSQTAIEAFADTGVKIKIVDGYCGTVTKKNVSSNSSNQDTLD